MAEAGALDRGLERILAQQSGPGAPERPRILELNPHHQVVAGLARRAREDGISGEIEDAAWLLFDQARILDGETVSDPGRFGERLMRLMGRGFCGAADS